MRNSALIRPYHSAGQFLSDLADFSVQGSSSYAMARLEKHPKMFRVSADPIVSYVAGDCQSPQDGVLVPECFHTIRPELMAVASLSRQIAAPPREYPPVVIPSVSVAVPDGVRLSAASHEETILGAAKISAYFDIPTSQMHIDDAVADVLLGDSQDALRAVVEHYAINGDGTDGNVTGIRETPNKTEVVYDDDQPMAEGLVSHLKKLISDTAYARGLKPDCLVFSHRTWNWLSFQRDLVVIPQLDMSAAPPRDVRLPGRVGRVAGVDCYVSGGVRCDFGDGRDQSEVYAFLGSDLLISESSRAPTVSAEQVNVAGEPNTRFKVSSVMLFSPVRHPCGVGVLSGTGLRAAL